MSLSNRVFRAGIWVSIAFAIARLFGLIRLTVLTHLLLPIDFGLVTIVTLVVSSIWFLTDAGITSAVIQKKNASSDFLHTAFHINWVRGFILSMVCWFLAPLAATFFEQPRLEYLLQLAAVIPFIQGLESLGMTLLKKELNFKIRTMVDFIREAMQTIVAIGLALYWKADAEVIVWGMIAAVVAATVVSYAVHAYRPSLSFHQQSAIEIWKYGAHLMGAGILIFAMTNLDDAVVGKILGVEVLGYYGVAFALAAILTNQLVQVFNTVMFPALSHIQTETKKIQSILGLSVQVMAGTLTPVVCFVVLFSVPLIEFLLSERWVPAASVFVILVCMGWARGIATVFGPILLARKRTKTIHAMKWKEFAIFAVSIVPAVLWIGMEGAAYVLLVVYCLSLLLHMKAVSDELSTAWSSVIPNMVSGSLAGVVALIGTWVLLYIFPEIKILLAVLFYTVLWAMVVWMRDKVVIQKVLSMVRQ